MRKCFHCWQTVNDSLAKYCNHYGKSLRVEISRPVCPKCKKLQSYPSIGAYCTQCGSHLIIKSNLGTTSSVQKGIRDKILLSSQLGRKFIELYYRHAPSIARIIEKSKLLQNIVLVLLIKPIATILKMILLTQESSDHCENKPMTVRQK
jgi:hypothetical protein